MNDNKNEFLLSLSKFHTDEPCNQLALLNKILQKLNHDTSSLVLSFLMNIQDERLSIPLSFQHSFDFLFNLIYAKLKEVIKPEFSIYIQNLKKIQYKFEEKKKENFSLYDKICEINTQILIQKSSKEFDNLLNIFFNLKKKIRVHNYINENLANIEEVDDKVQSYFLFCAILDENKIKKVLDYFLNVPTNLSTFCYILYFTRPILYKAFVHYIFEHSFYLRLNVIKSLPVLENVNLKNLNEEFLKYFFENFTSFRDEILVLLSENVKKRHLFLKFIIAYYELISTEKLNDLNFSYEEHIQIAESNFKHVYYIFKTMTELDLENEGTKNLITHLIKVIFASPQLIDFVEYQLNAYKENQNSNFLFIFELMSQNKRFYQLKDFILEKIIKKNVLEFKDERRIFFWIMSSFGS